MSEETFARYCSTCKQSWQARKSDYVCPTCRSNIKSDCYNMRTTPKTVHHFDASSRRCTYCNVKMLDVLVGKASTICPGE